MSELEAENSDDNFDDWEASDDDQEEFKGLFTNEVYSSTAEVFAAAQKLGFNFLEIKTKTGADFYGCIRIINFVRTQVKESNGPIGADDVKKIVSTVCDPKATFWKDDAYLRPALADDALLFSLDDDDDDVDDQETKGASEEEKKKDTAQLERENQQLKLRLQQMEKNMTSLQQSMSQLILTTGVGTTTEKTDAKTTGDIKLTDEEKDSGYFESYSDRRIHELMLRDTTRTEAYRDFMYKNKELFAGKVVLDIGCGTGILSMFAATAGAKQVIGIDKAEMVQKARIIVKDNKLDDRITLIQSEVEKAKLPVDKVDIIISEWMGYFLLFESMLPTVMFARDKWLADGGGVYPNKATLYIAGMETKSHQAKNIEFWKDVYGFNMNCLIDPRDVYLGSTTEIVDNKELTTEPFAFQSFDMMTDKPEQLDFTSSFSLTATRKHNLDALITYFDTDFDLRCKNPIKLSTGPATNPTHWKQSLFHLRPIEEKGDTKTSKSRGKILPLNLDKGDNVEGTLTAKRSGLNLREYDVTIRYCIKRAGDTGAPVYYVQEYHV